MFWKYDDEEDKVLPKEPEKPAPSKPVEEDDGFKSSNEDGSEERFVKRVAVFNQEDKPVYKHHGWWFIHNCIAHPLIGIFPCKSTFDFHDWTSTKINGK